MYYIKRITYSGEKVKTVFVDLQKGLNIFYGPSDTGKSYIIDSIRYMMGAGKCRIDPETQYEKIRIDFETDEGFLSMERAIVNGNKVTVEGSIGDFEPGEYGIDGKSKKNISDIWLYLMGVKEPVRILGGQEYKDVAFTIGTFAYMLVVDEEVISQQDSIIMTKHDFSKMACQSALLYLLTGNNYWDGQKHIPKKERDMRRDAQIEYMTEFLMSIEEDYKKKKAEYAGASRAELEEKIETILGEIDSAESELTGAIEESRNLAARIHKLDMQISECIVMQNRYSILKGQYSSDIQRLTFIVEGEVHKAGLPQIAKCPFCDGEIKKRDEESCAEAAKEEIKRLLPQIQDLEDAVSDADSEVDELTTERESLDALRKELEDKINSEMQPKLDELRDSLVRYTRAIEERKEEDVYKSFVSNVGGRIRNLEDTKNVRETYVIEENFEAQKFTETFDVIFGEVLEETHFGEVSSALFSLSDYDVVVNNKKKFRYGQGYRAFLNTDVLITVQEYLRRHGKHQPGILAIDSPTLTLKEKPVENEASHGMKYGLFKYLLEHQREDQQVIIIENDLPDMDKLNYASANVQYFSKDPKNGRYGLLDGVTS